MDYAKESLKMHYELRGKLEVTSRAAVDTKDALSLAYTPGCYRWNRSSRTWRYRPGGRHAGHGRKMRAV